MKKAKLVILVGIDGSGKSTILSYLEKKGYLVSHWRKLAKLPLSKSLNFRNPAEVVQTLSGKKRFKFLWRYIDSEWKYLIRPALEHGNNIVSDGFFIRFLTKEKIYQKLAVTEFVKRSPLMGKELIIMIDVPPQVALERKKKLIISPYECLKSPDDFIYFQSLQRKILLELIKRFPHVVIDGTLPKEKLAKKVLLVLKENQIEP